MRYQVKKKKTAINITGIHEGNNTEPQKKPRQINNKRRMKQPGKRS